MANAINSLKFGSNTYTFTLPYGTCSTAAGTAAKTVDVDNFSLETGARVLVKFTVTNTASSPTLNVESTGAKAIYYRGSAVSAGYLAANRTYEFVYNGTQWDLIGDLDTNSTYSAAGSSLGLVKSGGDVSISSGVITVNDDSHNHTIANIDNLQTSLDAKQATITGAATTITGTNLTDSRALVSDSSGKVAVSAVTSTELGYLDGVTSAIQTQIDGKAASSHNHAASNITSGTLSSDRLPTVPIAKGGTGATTAAGALTNLGVTATATELNYVDGVTSNIQTQLNGKASSSHTHNYAGSDSAGGAANAAYAKMPVTTSGTGAAYTATVAGITALTKGVSFVMVPHTASTTTQPTLNVNGLGAKGIRRRLSNISTSVQSGYSNNWLGNGQPFTVVYNGTYWIVEGNIKTAAVDLYGTLSVDKGGTGATTAVDARTNLGIVVVTALPSTIDENTIYFVKEG